MSKLSSTNQHNRRLLTLQCPITLTFELIGGRYKAPLLWGIHEGVVRYGAMRKNLAMITEKMLTQQLRELEADGLITRTVFAEVPPRVEYSLTELGKTLIPVLEVIEAWGEKAIDAVGS